MQWEQMEAETKTPRFLVGEVQSVTSRLKTTKSINGFVLEIREIDK